VKLFRVTVSTNRTEFVATNDKTQTSTDDAQEVCGVVGRLREFHPQQLTGVKPVNAAKARIQHQSHCLCLLLVWSRLKLSATQHRQNCLSDQAWDAVRLSD